MGNTTSTSAPSSGECPVVQRNGSGDAATCPVPPELRKPAVYNVYGQVINDPSKAAPNSPLDALKNRDLLDPVNNMPLEPNQQPFPGQTKPLPTARQQSTIPKGGTESTWTYPSPQMFYNALKRKGKGDDVAEDNMTAVVWAHNTMNERTWQNVLVWEKLHREVCSDPKLLHFRGRPHDLSPLARLRMLLGGPEPFDRHDWVIDRCGQEVRYVIDFYYYDDKAGTPEAFEVVARPAVDTLDSAVDRLKMAVYTKFAEWGLPCPITGQAGEVGREALEKSTVDG